MAANLADILDPRRLDRVHRTAVAQAVSMPFVSRESGLLRVLSESLTVCAPAVHIPLPVRPALMLFVVNTHFHWDHYQGNEAGANACVGIPEK